MAECVAAVYLLREDVADAIVHLVAQASHVLKVDGYIIAFLLPSVVRLHRTGIGVPLLISRHVVLNHGECQAVVGVRQFAVELHNCRCGHLRVVGVGEVCDSVDTEHRAAVDERLHIEFVFIGSVKTVCTATVVSAFWEASRYTICVRRTLQLCRCSAVAMLCYSYELSGELSVVLRYLLDAAHAPRTLDACVFLHIHTLCHLHVSCDDGRSVCVVSSVSILLAVHLYEAHLQVLATLEVGSVAGDGELVLGARSDGLLDVCELLFCVADGVTNA